MTKQKSEIIVTIEFTDQEAWDLAQFFKKVDFTDYRSNAIDEAEANRMLAAGEKSRKILALQGYQP
jgi:cytochrome c